MIDLQAVADSADMIVNGYAFKKNFNNEKISRPLHSHHHPCRLRRLPSLHQQPVEEGTRPQRPLSQSGY